MKANDISPEVQRHLSEVYLMLAGAVAVAAAGAYTHLLFNLGGLLSLLATFGCMVRLSVSPRLPASFLC